MKLGRKKQSTTLTFNSLEEYRLTHDRCAVCYSKGRSWNDRLEIHHIIAGRHGGKDKHDERALVILCRDCHEGYHSGGGHSLSLGQILQAKLEADGSVDVSFLAGLRGRVGLREDPSPLPLWAEEARRDNQ